MRAPVEDPPGRLRLPLALLVVVAGGIGSALAFEPFSWWPLLPAAPAALAAATYGRGWRAGAGIGLLLGAAFFGVSLFWLRSVGYDAWVLLGGVQTLFFAPLGAYAALVSRTRLWPLLVAVGWVAVETVRSAWPLGGFPWVRLGFATPDSVWAPLMPYAAASGTALLVALTGALVAWAAIRRPPLRRLAPVLAAVVLVTAVPHVTSYEPQRSGEAVVAVVQGNVPGDGTNILDDHRQMTFNQRDATLTLADDVASGSVPQPDLVVWPENSTAVDPFENEDMTEAITTAVAAVGAPILVGAIVDAPEPGQVLNQGIVWDPVTGAGERYTKHHPVPFGEYIPWREHNPLTSRFERFAQISRDMLAGSGHEPLAIDGFSVADSLCFDIAFDDVVYPQVRRGAAMITVQTSNATYSRTEQLDQQFQLTRARALETGRVAAVAATNGLAGIIDADGTVLDAVPRRTQGYAIARVTLGEGTAPAILLGPWIAWGAVVSALVALLWALARYPRPDRLEIAPAVPPTRVASTTADTRRSSPT